MEKEKNDVTVAAAKAKREKKKKGLFFLFGGRIRTGRTPAQFFSLFLETSGQNVSHA